VLDTNTSPAPAIAATRCADMHGNAPDVIADHFTLPGVQPGADLNAERPDFVGDGASAAHTTCGTVESSKNAIAKRERVRRTAV
jgi:hypothetical protein